jgi:hypothetical protein
MRIVKLSTQEFDDEKDVGSFFNETLRSRATGKAGGKFRIPSGWIAEDGLYVDEPLVFSHQAVLLYSARAGTGRRTNHDEESEHYPFYFDVNVESIRPVKERITLLELQERLERVTGIKRNIAARQGWNSIPDSTATDELWDSLRE